MSSANKKYNNLIWVHLFFALILFATYFLPWVSWDGNLVKGSDMAGGNFFTISNSKFGLENPFPQFSFAFYSFWLIPLLALIIVIVIFSKKKTTTLSFIAATISLALVTIYYLFTKILIDLGAGENVFDMLMPAVYVHALSAISLIITVFPVKTYIYKLLWIVLGPVLAIVGFTIGEKYVMGETYEATDKVKSDYSLKSAALLNEFFINDSAANKKYREKTLEIEGVVSAIEIKEDSSSIIKFEDTRGIYADFSFEKNQFEKTRSIKQLDTVIVKGVCSGSVSYEIIDQVGINFKRSTLINKKTKQ